MTNNNVIPLNKPEEIDPLQEILQAGTRKLLASAVEAEIDHFLAQHNSETTEKATVVRNGYLSERTI